MTLLGDKTYFEVVDDFLRNGHRLSKPELCPKHIYDIMLQCWHEKHWFRPSFSKLKILLKVRIFQKVFFSSCQFSRKTKTQKVDFLNVLQGQFCGNFLSFLREVTIKRYFFEIF